MRHASVAVAALLIIPGASHAQTHASITGVVRDTPTEILTARFVRFSVQYDF
jgi:hypothetical protein